MDDFTEAYLTCALWSSTDDNGCALDADYGVEDIAPATLYAMIADCAKFQADNAALIADSLTTAGHDFWLTRNGHGAGFWEGDWGEHGAELTFASKAFGPFDLYVGDDNRIYA